MKKMIHNIFSIAMFLCAFSLFAQQNYWTELDKTQLNRSVKLENLDSNEYKTFQLDVNSFKQQLLNAPLIAQVNGRSNSIVSFPNQEGKLEKFRIFEAPVLSEELSQQFPNIKTYLGYGIDNTMSRIRFSVTPQGVQTMMSTVDEPTSFLVPLVKGDNSQYIAYTRKARINSPKDFECLTTEEYLSINSDGLANRDANDQILRTFRIAISTTGEYTNFWDDGNAGNGNAQADALAQVVSTLNRTNEVFEVDMAVTFTLVSGTSIIYPNANTDPYTNNPNGQLQSTLTTQIGEANYDIGHLFMFAGANGSAGCIGCVCVNNQKGSGFSSHPFTDNDGGPYMSDFFDIDYVPHEIGHQMGANHTWSFGNEGTGVQAEPGSGTTIMGYAGITNINDVQDHTDPYFHYRSIEQILNNINSSCAMTTPIVNNPPIADAGNNYTIPNGTAFVLKGDGSSDPNGGDQLTYTWEQIDNGVTTSGNFGPTKTSGSVWRSRPPSSSTDRFMPIFYRVLTGQLTETNPVESTDNSTWETVSTVGRTLNFGLTVRDRSETGGTGQTPQSDFDTMAVTVNGVAGPFAVTSQNTPGITWNFGNTETISWDVAGTTANGVNTSNVNILLSTDDGVTFNTVLVANTPNDGTQDISVPNVTALNCRIMIEAVDNIYYAVNSIRFTIGNFVTSCTIYPSSSNLNLAIVDGDSGAPGQPILQNIINIPDSVTIESMTVNVDITHSFISDLIVRLFHPDGTTFVDVWVTECGGEDDFDITFDDTAAAIVCTQPTVGTFTPSNPLNAFNGLDAQGDWTILVPDFFAGDVGFLNDWSIEICSEQTLNTEDFSFEDFLIYPNPNKGTFNVKMNGLTENNVDITVYDIRGRKVFDKRFESSSAFDEEIQLNTAQSGFYLVKVSNGLREVIKKIIIE